MQENVYQYVIQHKLELIKDANVKRTKYGLIMQEVVLIDAQ